MGLRRKFPPASLWALLSFLAVLSVTNPLYSARFDCNLASTNVEKLICADSTLSELDDKMDSAYEAALVSTADRNALLIEHREWIVFVLDKCEDASCLKKVYAERIVKLIPQALNREGSGTGGKDFAHEDPSKDGQKALKGVYKWVILVLVFIVAIFLRRWSTASERKLARAEEERRDREREMDQKRRDTERLYGCSIEEKNRRINEVFRNGAKEFNRNLEEEHRNKARERDRKKEEEQRDEVRERDRKKEEERRDKEREQKRRREQIGSVVQRGNVVYVYNELGESIAATSAGEVEKGEGLKGYTSTTFSVQRCGVIYTYNARGESISATSAPAR